MIQGTRIHVEIGHRKTYDTVEWDCILESFQGWGSPLVGSPGLLATISESVIIC